jgi:2-polyprenyl-6-methoxyphenol hydroxylase-like FAD-dependent oxidoreductase
MYDAIVIGARAAGAPTAMLLARKGYRVLLLDRARFPSDTLSTHYLQPDGARRLQQWGLLQRLIDAGTPPIPRLTFDIGRAALPAPSAPDGPPAFCPRRTVLDTILVDAAAAAGAEVREGFSVGHLLFEDGRVAGVRGRAGGGAVVEERARIVVGADGRHSLVARTVQPAAYNVRPPLGCGYYSYWSGIPHDGGAELHLRDGNALFLFPTNDGRCCVAVEWQNHRFREVRADIEGSFFAALAKSPALAERVRAGTREERFLGTADLPNFFRTPYGPGWALVGDAGYHKDPITGTGITDAFRDAELLADAIDAGFAGRESIDAALAGYERRRNEAASPMYEITCRLAELRPPGPHLAALFGRPPAATPVV